MSLSHVGGNLLASSEPHFFVVVLVFLVRAKNNKFPRKYVGILIGGLALLLLFVVSFIFEFFG